MFGSLSLQREGGDAESVTAVQKWFWIEGKRAKYCDSTLRVSTFIALKSFLQASSHQTGSPIPTFPSINLCLRTLFESLSLQRQDEDAESVTAMQKIIFPGEFQKTVLLQNGGKSVKYFCNILNILINSDELFREFAQISSSFLPVSSWLVSLAYISRQL